MTARRIWLVLSLALTVCFAIRAVSGVVAGVSLSDDRGAGVEPGMPKADAVSVWA